MTKTNSKTSEPIAKRQNMARIDSDLLHELKLEAVFRKLSIQGLIREMWLNYKTKNKLN